MEKMIIGILVAGCMLFAAPETVEFKSNLFDLNKVKNKEMKDFLIAVEASFPSMGKIIKDYYDEDCQYRLKNNNRA